MKKIVINCIIIFSIIITAIFLTTLNSYAIDRDPNSSKGFAEFDDEAAAQETQELIQEQQEEQENQQNTTNGDKPLEETETSSDIENNVLSNTDNQVVNEVEETNSTQSSSVIEENVNRFSIDADLLIFLTIIAIIIVIIFITVLVRKSKGKK